jgi:hypothetical protein
VTGTSSDVPPNNAMHLTGNSRLCRLLPAGDRERWVTSTLINPRTHVLRLNFVFFLELS